jgi:cytoskeletal protein RodZ
MKKISAIIMILAVTVSLLSGCFRVPKNVVEALQSAKPSVSADSDSQSTPGNDSDADASADSDADTQESSAPVSLSPAKNPSEGYTNYITVKGAATDRITAASENSDALAMAASMSMLGIAMVDLSCIALTGFSGDAAASEMAFGMLGMKDVDITQKGNDYSITYTDANGDKLKQTCTYDVSKDQLTSTAYNADGSVSMFFEYVNLGGAYAAQYYYPEGDGYQVIRSYFDKDNIAAFGTLAAKDEPDSIIGKTDFSEEFAKNDESYLLLKNGKLTVFDKGTSTTD